MQLINLTSSLNLGTYLRRLAAHLRLWLRVTPKFLNPHKVTGFWNTGHFQTLLLSLTLAAAMAV